MPTLRGILASESGNILIPDVLPELTWKFGNLAPFLVFQEKIGRRLPAKNYEFSHYETDFRPYSTSLAAAILATDTTISVVDASGFRVDEVVQVQDAANSESMLITAVDYANNTITVQRGFGSVPAAAHAAGKKIISVGDANTEGGSLLTPITKDYSKVTNYTQEFEEPIQLTLRDLKVEKYAGDEYTNRVTAAQKNILLRIDRSFFRGLKHKTGGEATLRTTTGGLWEYLYQNRTTNVSFGAGAAPTLSVFYNGIKVVAENGADFNSSVLVAGSNWVKFFTDTAIANNLRVSPDDTTFGITVQRLLTPWGALPLIFHQALSQTNGWSGDMYFVDFSQVIRREITPLGFFTDVEVAPKVKTHMYYADLGWQFQNPGRYYYWNDYSG